MRRSIAGLAVVVASVAHAAAPALPAMVAEAMPGLEAVGSHHFRYLLFHVYDATLWAPQGRWSAASPFVLDIRYALDIRGRDLSKRSIEEMRKLGHDDAAKLARWAGEMDRVFPDIKPGDRLVGVHVPGREARFYSARGLLGTVPDGEFARAFFDIWLAERTSEPAMRRGLLGTAAR